MSEQKGLLKTCNRCRATVFLNYIGKGYADGGYTTWDKFESAPEGWECFRGIGTLCPKCSRKYVQIVEKFMKDCDKNDDGE